MRRSPRAASAQISSNESTPSKSRPRPSRVPPPSALPPTRLAPSGPSASAEVPVPTTASRYVSGNSSPTRAASNGAPRAQAANSGTVWTSSPVSSRASRAAPPPVATSRCGFHSSRQARRAAMSPEGNFTA